MPDLDTDSTAEAKEYTGPVDPSDVAATTKKRKTKKKKKSHKKRRSFANTGSETSLNISESCAPVEHAPIDLIPPVPQVLPETQENEFGNTSQQVVVAVPVLRETSNAKRKRFVWSLGIDPDFPNFFVDDNHYQDKLLIRHILQESPWRVKHGTQKTSSETIMSTLADQQHHSENVFEGASLITIRQRYEGYLNLARRWTLERERSIIKKRNLKMKSVMFHHRGQQNK